jgi:hypothetical protein
MSIDWFWQTRHLRDVPGSGFEGGIFQHLA